MATIESVLQHVSRLKHENADLKRLISDLIKNQDKYTEDRCRALEDENKRLKQAIIRLVTTDGKNDISK